MNDELMKSKLEEEINLFRGGQYLLLEIENDGNAETLKCKLEMKVYDTNSFPYQLSAIIVAPVNDSGERIEEGMYYEKEFKLKEIKSISKLEI